MNLGAPRRVCVALAAASSLLVGPLSQVSEAAVPVAGKLTTTTPTVHPDGAIRLTAKVPAKEVRRRVVLQQATSSGWRRVTSKLSTRRGVASFRVFAPSRTGTVTLRAWSPKVATKAVTYKAVRTPSLRIHVTAPAAGTPDPTPTPTPTEPPAPALGTRSNPYPIDTTFHSGTWDFSFGTTNPDDAANEEAYNQFTTPPAPGWSYIAVPVTVTYKGDQTGQPWIDTRVEFVGGDGIVYNREADQDQMCLTPNDYNELPEMYPGATATGVQCAVVRTSAIAGGLWRANGSSYGDAPDEFVKQN